MPYEHATRQLRLTERGKASQASEESPQSEDSVDPENSLSETIPYSINESIPHRGNNDERLILFAYAVTKTVAKSAQTMQRALTASTTSKVAQGAANLVATAVAGPIATVASAFSPVPGTGAVANTVIQMAIAKNLMPTLVKKMISTPTRFSKQCANTSNSPSFPQQ